MLSASSVLSCFGKFSIKHSPEFWLTEVNSIHWFRWFIPFVFLLNKSNLDFNHLKLKRNVLSVGFKWDFHRFQLFVPFKLFSFNSFNFFFSDWAKFNNWSLIWLVFYQIGSFWFFLGTNIGVLRFNLPLNGF